MTKVRVFVFLLLLPFLGGAQEVVDFTFQLDSTTTMVLTGGWTQSDLQTSQFVTDSQRLFEEMKTISLPIGKKWTVIKKANASASGSCPPLTYWGPGFRNLDALAHEMFLALFDPCDRKNVRTAGDKESYSEGKVAVLYRKLAAKGDPDFQPVSRLGMNQSYTNVPFLAAHSGLGQYVVGDGTYEASWVWELFAAKLGGTFIPIDRALATGMSAAQAVDEVVGEIAGHKASVWLQNTPKLFSLTSDQRKALGFAIEDDPTDGLWLSAVPIGSISGWAMSSTPVNPFCLSVYLWEMKSGVRSFGKGLVRYRIMDLSRTELYSTTINMEGGINPAPWPKFASGVNPAEVCLLKDGVCDPQNTLKQNFIFDSTGWTAGKMVVITGDLTTKLQLAEGQAYSLTIQNGAITVSGLPSSYTEVALTDGKVTRKFPWVHDVPNGNIYNWNMLDNPVLLSVVDAATFQYSGEITPGSWNTLWAVGATHGNPDFVSPNTKSEWPTEACSNEYGKTRVVFSSNSNEWFGWMNYCSTQQVNVLSPSDLPVGQIVNVQIELNGTRSNTRTLRVVEAQPRIFTVGSLGATIHQDGKLADKANPAVSGEWLSIYGSGFGPVDGAAPDGPAPFDRFYRCINPFTISVAGVVAETNFCGLAPGYSGLYQVNFRVPSFPSGDHGKGSDGPIEAPLQVTIGKLSANQVVLPVF